MISLQHPLSSSSPFPLLFHLLSGPHQVTCRAQRTKCGESLIFPVTKNFLVLWV